MPTEPTPQCEKWLGTTVTYEGFPLALRVRVGADSLENISAYSDLVVVEHVLAKVKPNGFPENEYNESLFDLDLDLVEFLEQTSDGITVLIETFIGKRNYYFYAKHEAPVIELFTKLRSKHSQYELTISIKSNPTWSFLAKYRKEFPW